MAERAVDDERQMNLNGGKLVKDGDREDEHAVATEGVAAEQGVRGSNLGVVRFPTDRAVCALREAITASGNCWRSPGKNHGCRILETCKLLSSHT